MGLVLPGPFSSIVPQARAHSNEAVPLHTVDHGVGAADGAFWNVVEGMATKTGARLVFWWDADVPVAGVVEWGFAPTGLTYVLVPLGDPVDAAQVAVFDIPADDVVPGRFVHFRVRDLQTGALSPPASFPLGNAHGSDAGDGVAEINLVVQVDSATIPPGLAVDEALVDATRAVDVMAERVWDATDGYVRIGTVLVTDEPLLAAPNVNVDGAETCPESLRDQAATVGHPLADFVVSTHGTPVAEATGGIACPASSVHLGRIEDVAAWRDDLRAGAAMTGALGHYAFGMDALDGCTAGTAAPPDNANGQVDVSVMGGAFGWSGARWLGSEFDRTATPCERGAGAVSWDALTALYANVPPAGRNGDGLPVHDDSAFDRARGNPDGGALEVFVFDDEILASEANQRVFAPPSQTSDPTVTIETPTDGAAVAPGVVALEGVVDRRFEVANDPPFSSLEANPTSGLAPLDVAFAPSATDGDGVVASWSLDYGDGTPSSGGSGGPPSIMQHTYATEGTFRAQLTVADDRGAVADAAVDVAVGVLAGTTRIGTDAANDTATECGSDAAPCQAAWFAATRDGLDLTALHVRDAGDALRFIWTVNDGEAFFADASGDPQEATDPGTVVAYCLSATFHTSPLTSYALGVERADGSSALVATLGSTAGPVLRSPVVGAAFRQGDLFWADVSKSQLPETAVFTTLTELGGHSSILQRGVSAPLPSTTDTLDDVERTSVVITRDELPGRGGHLPAILLAPSVAPASPLLDDALGDVFISAGLANLTGPAAMDVGAVWLDHDLHNLYVGMKVADLPADEAVTDETAYGVSFHPGWSREFGVIGSDREFLALRVEAVRAPVRLGDGAHVLGTESRFELQALATDGEATKVAARTGLPLSSLDPATDIVWWVVPRTLLHDPPTDATLTEISADTQAAPPGGLARGSGVGDVAQGPGDSYSLTRVAFPLAADAGGPYRGVVGEPLHVQALPLGGTPPYACAWSGPPNAAFADASSCATTVVFSDDQFVSLKVEATDGVGSLAEDGAPASLVAPDGEQVEVSLDGRRVPGASVAVATSSSAPADRWRTSVDLTAVPFGAHVLAATWRTNDGATLDEASVTIEVAGGPPFVTIDAPLDGVVVEGLITISGAVGHVGGPPPGPPVNESVRIHLDTVLLAEFAVDTSLGDDAWTTWFDADAQDPGTHTIRAEYADGRGGLAERAVVVEVPEPPNPFLTVEGPAPGAPVALPVTITGRFSTTGDPPPEGFGSQEVDGRAGALPLWATSEYVASVLASSAFRSLDERLGVETGYVGSFPTPADGGHVVAVFDGAIPAGVPSKFQGRPIEYLAHVEPQPLQRIASGEPQNARSLAQLRSMSAADLDLWSEPPHEGPGMPGPQRLAGPGGAIQTTKRDVDGVVKSFVCTASYLFENPATDTYYLATAGHCLLDFDATSSVERPAGRARTVSLCVSNCWNNGIGFGNYVTLAPEADYHPVAFAVQAGIGSDFGLVEVPEEVTPLLRPWVWFWNGPTSADRPSSGDLLVHYGHGTASPLFPIQGRAAVATSANGVSVRALGQVTNGDSGSALGTAALRPDGLVAGDGAAGTITHVAVSAEPALLAGTDLGRGLDLAEAALGFRPLLVTEDKPIREPSVDLGLRAAIDEPIPGAVLDPFDGRFAQIAGEASFPPAALPGVETQTYFLHRTSCDASAVLHMDTTRGAQPDAGDGCGRTFGPAGYVWEAVVGELSDVFPTVPKPSSTTYLDASRRVDATMVLRGFRAVEGGQSVPSLLLDVEARLYAGVRLVGQQRVQDEVVLGPDTPVRFSFFPMVPTATPDEGLSFVFVVHQADGPVFVRYGGPMGSSLRLPLGVAPGNRVEVSVDDPTFAAGRLAVTGDEAWSATWDLQGVASGPHRIHARAMQDGQPDGTPVAHDVTVSSTFQPPTAAFTASIGGLRVEFTDSSLPGDLPIASYRWTFGDGAASIERNPVHSFPLGGRYDVRLVVTDQGGYADDARLDIQVGHDWGLEVRIVDALGAVVLPWTVAAEPVDGLAGPWELRWEPDPLPPNGAYVAEARLLRDGAVTDTDDLPLLVRVNHPPVLGAIGARTVAEGSALALQLAALDEDGDVVTYGAAGLPSGATLTPAGLFQWSPGFTQAGAYSVTFRAADPFGAFDGETVAVTVTETNRAPAWGAATPRTVKSGNLLNFAIAVSDPDGQPVQKSIVASPTGLAVTFTSSGAFVAWTPQSGQVGVHTLTLSATDGAARSDVSITITVLADEPPTAAIAGPVALEAGNALYDGRGSSDPERRPLTYAWALVRGSDVLATGSASTFGVTFVDPGAYEVRLTVRDPQGNAGTASLLVRIDDFVVLALALVGDDGGAYSPTAKAVVRACATWASDGEPAVGGLVTMTASMEANGGAVPLPTQPQAGGTTAPSGCIEVELPFDVLVANVPGPHRVDARITSPSRAGDALMDDETDDAVAFYDVGP